MVKCLFCNGQHNDCFCPQTYAAISGFLSLEDVFLGAHLPDADDNTCSSSTLT